jgi:polo-like kinase 1
MLTYISRRGEKSTYPLLTALESSNHEMAKRLKYTKEILTHMINNNSTAANGNMMTTGAKIAEK